MRKTKLGAVLAALLLSACGSPQQNTNAISLSGAFALYPLTVKWAEEYKKTHPDVKIDVSAGGAGKGITDVLNGVTDIGLVSRSLTQAELQKGAVVIPVTRDAVVPTISAANPLLKDIEIKGVTKDGFYGVFISGAIKTWGQLGFSGQDPVHVYTRSDAAGAAETWAAYLGKKQDDLKGTAVFGDPGLAQAVQKDPGGIGFNNIAFVYDPQTKQLVAGVVPLPIDQNGNGKIDPEEAVYGTLDQITAAIAAGKYPSPPARDLYFVTKGVPNAVAKDFIKFALTEGQKDVAGSGYILLTQDKINEGLKKIQ
ncbi:PstS family phosphate ABC transporter substrate-binding protein [Dinghuibacter silviterrae]|uniref:Phosphate transport system substrate-binding protein n=1 Tax=Dinghuibacter silviterrae TaxID=1539049 RepID=A0A4R8DQ58_9BACT|nr:substrate-binding domain-containing protein [Dinghuibacter silviterrae]TDX00262.1 phosphate transport system substrate-binding protein [Dinghuibacter silviterrae]